MKINIFKWVLVIVFCGLVGYALYITPRKESQKDIENEPVVGAISKTSDPNVNTYVSSALGIKFNYAVVDPILSQGAGELDAYGHVIPEAPMNEVIENKNEITTTGGGVVKVFSKDPKVSFVDEIKQKFNASNCKVVLGKDPQNIKPRAYIYFPDLVDGRGESKPKWGGFNGDPILSEKDKKCIDENKYTPNYFEMDEKYPDRYIGVYFSLQSPEGVLSVDKDNQVITWMSTIEFIAKN